MSSSKKMSASEIVETEATRQRQKSALDDALLVFRRVESNRDFKAGQLAQTEARVAELAETVKLLTKIEQDFGKIPTTTLQRLRSRVPSDFDGGRGIAYNAAIPGITVRDQVAGLLAHARQQLEAVRAEAEALRPEVAKAEAELGPIAARVEDLKLAATAG